MAYSQNHYDALDRVTSVELPGKAWRDADKRNRTQYSANTDSDMVLHYVANPNGKYSLVKPDDKTNPYQYYPAGTLTKASPISGHANSTNVWMRRLSTASTITSDAKDNGFHPAAAGSAAARCSPG